MFLKVIPRPSGQDCSLNTRKHSLLLGNEQSGVLFNPRPKQCTLGVLPLAAFFLTFVTSSGPL